MLKGLGVDIARNDRFASMSPGLLEKIFTEKELEGLAPEGSPARAERLASRFAAKEAFAKALGTGFRGFAPKDVEIFEDNLGKPYVNYSADLFPQLAGSSVLLSISHERDHSVAVVAVDGAL